MTTQPTVIPRTSKQGSPQTEPKNRSVGIRVTRTLINYTLVTLLATTFLGVAFTGILIGLVIPKDIEDLWGVNRSWWREIHLSLALAFMAFVIIHFALHWSWLSAASRTCRLRSVASWSSLVLGLAFLSVYVGLIFAPQQPPVSASRGLGRNVYLAQKCDACHAIKGVGGTVGPDLTHVGSARTPEWITAEIVDPAAHNPGTVMPPHELPEDELTALVDYLVGLK